MNYSFRKKNKTVKYIVIHYTGMQSLKSAYYKLSDINSDVSAHYLISRKGKIFNFVCPRLKAWHAGKSQWKKEENLNDFSIGIELENRGHDYGYQEFTSKQYNSLKKLINFLISIYRVKSKNIIYHSDISPNRKKDPGEKFYLNKIGINRFKKSNFKKSKKISINEMLKIYGFSKKYINRYFPDCIMAAKRSMNYKSVNPIINEKFKRDFINLLFQ